MAANPYDLLAPAYDQETHSATALGFAAIFGRATRDARPRRILDVGCGTGVLAERLNSPASAVVGVDRSWGMLRKAQARLAGSKPTAVVRADMMALPFAARFDAVVACNEVVNQIPTDAVRSWLLQACRVLRPGGWLCFDALHADHFARFWDRRHWEEQSGSELLWMDCWWEPAQRRGVARCTAIVTDRGRSRIRTTLLTEYLHEVSAIEDALRSSGFIPICREPWNPYPEPQPEGFVDRSVWIARLATGT